MQRMEWRNNRLQPIAGRKFLMRIIAAHLEGLTPEQFADQELALARMEAKREDKRCQNLLPPPG